MSDLVSLTDLLPLIPERGLDSGIDRNPASPTAGSRLNPSRLDDVLLVSGPLKKPAPSAELWSGTIDPCPDCKGPLDLPAPQVGLPTETWRCMRCRAVVVTGLTLSGGPGERVAERVPHDRPTPIDQLPASQPAALRALLTDLVGGRYLENERREWPRYAVSLPALGAPMTADFRVVRTPFRVTTRDLSMDGLSGFTEVPFATPHVLIDFTPAGYPGWQVAVRVVRRRPLGFLHEFGGMFVRS